MLANNAICIFEESGELIGCEPHMMARAVDSQARDDIDKAMAKGLIRTAPHNNPQLAGLSVVMRLVDVSRRACLQATESTPTP